MKRRRLIPGPLLMVISILGIAAFQFYWLQQNYEREEKTLSVRAEMLFRESVMKLQVSKLKLDGVWFDSAGNKGMRIIIGDEKKARFPSGSNEEVLSTINVIRDKLADSFRKDHSKEKRAMVIAMQTSGGMNAGKDSLKFDMDIPPPPGSDNHVINLLYGVDSLQDSLRITEIDSAYRLALIKQKLSIPFTILRNEKTGETENQKFRTVTIGLAHPVSYTLQLGKTFPYLVRRIAQPILFSVLLLGITILAFSLLYKNLLKQRRLAELKNEFISNITHELKTPIATVGVAIEALKNFNVIDDPARTREYLDISQHELHRLSLLVDKVLKLSMFENQGIELKYETVNLRGLVTEVVESLKLQLEKSKAEVTVQYEGETELQGDRLHLLSVLFNLLDNAIKYSREQPVISIDLKGDENQVQLLIKDNGIGIAPEYLDKVFEKFFRVPHGDTHNAKGYGLGLSYVAQVIKKHKGTIAVTSEPGKGTLFTISLPKNTS
ncbi:MAG: HAMP domain-containing histidine kinase [Sphingobacteriales bacterium]|nr:HAMP domain-containing histidine kinase [Sphingobacteriales bacterium]